MPGGLDTEAFGHDGDFAGRRESPNLADVAADVIDKTLGNQGLPFVGAVEELAHGDGGRAVLADLAEIGDVFGRKRVLHEKHFEFLDVLEELNGLVGGDALVDVMK